MESVWDYPRPPRVELVAKKLVVIFAGITIAETNHGFRVLETSHPPTYYFPPGDVAREYLKRTRRISYCEFKGEAAYWTIVAGGRTAEDAAWSYPKPPRAYDAIRDYFAFYAEPMDACFVGAERVTPQPGDFYGGWVTAEIQGPFKGGPGTQGW